MTVEEIVEDFGPRNLNAVILPSWTVGAIAVVPGGAYPSYAQGYYARDNAFYIDWEPIARDRDGFLLWMKQNVLDRGPEVFAQYARRRRPPPFRTRAGNTDAGSLPGERDDDDRGGAGAAQSRCLLRRHRAAVGRRQPGAA